MRPCEVLLVSALLISLVTSVLSTTSAATFAVILARVAAISLLLALLFFILHAVREGMHWQMIPAYISLVPACLLLWLVYRSRGGPFWLLEGIGLALLAVACIASYIVPMFHLPQPTGLYAVGTSILYMVDNDRLESAGPSASGKRELMVQLWYPAEPGIGKIAGYRRKQDTTLESSYQALVPTHSRIDAPVAHSGRPFPVLIFGPAWNGRRTQNTFLTEELASHGYVVAAIDHTYNSQPVVFPDGRVVWATAPTNVERMENTTPPEVEKFYITEADKQTADNRFVLDELAKLNQQEGSRWSQTMDTANAGAFGHSMGGAVAVESWATDPRIHAAVNMDGWQFGTQSTMATRAVSSRSEATPLLIMYEDGPAPSQPPPHSKSTWTTQEIDDAITYWDAGHVNALIEHYGGYIIKIKGAIHPSFIDRPLTSPLSRLSGAGSINPARMDIIVRDYVVQFFDQTLKNKSSSLLPHGEEKYKEIITLMSVSAPNAQTPDTPVHP